MLNAPTSLIPAIDTSQQLGPQSAIQDQLAGTKLEWSAVLSLSVLLWAGQLKGSPPFSFLPLDFTLLMLFVSVSTTGLLVTKGRQMPSVTGVLAAGLFIVIGIVGTLTYVPGELAVQKYTEFFLLTLVMILCAAANVRDRRSLLRFLLSFGAVAAYVSASTLIFGDTSDRGRITSTLGGTISFGRAAGTTLVVVAAYLLTARRMKAGVVVACLGLFAAQFYILVGIGSRGPFQALGLSGLVMLGMQFRRLRARLGIRIALLSIATACVGAVMWFQAPEFSRRRIIGIFTGEAGGRVGGGRNSAYEWTWEHLSFDLLGHGWGSWPRDSSVPAFFYPHNIFLELWYEAGVVGLACFLAALALSLRCAARSRSSDPFTASLSVGMLVYWLSSALVSADINGNRALFTLMAAAAASTIPGRRSSKEHHDVPTSQSRSPGSRPADAHDGLLTRSARFEEPI